MKFRKNHVKILNLIILTVFAVFVAYLSGCKNSTTNPYQTDEEYLQSLFTQNYSSSQEDDDNLMYSERYDMNDSGAVYDEGNGPMAPIDSLIRWGRIIDNVNVNFQGGFTGGDTLYTVNVTRTITGRYRIIGISNSQPDSVDKPYTEVLKRTVVFKRINRQPNPKLNWRLYQFSPLYGGTTSPENGNSNTQIVSLSVLVNGVPKYTLIGPNFDSTKFTTKYWGGAGIPEVKVGDVVTLFVVVNSSEQNNYVAWHWARNTFGFHRIPFTFYSAVSGGNGWYVTFTRTVTVYSGHVLGVFNGFINASTHESLYDNDISKFSSTEIGVPYRVKLF